MTPYSAPTLYERRTHPKRLLIYLRLRGAVRGGSIVTCIPTAGSSATSSTTRTHSVITIHGRTALTRTRYTRCVIISEREWVGRYQIEMGSLEALDMPLMQCTHGSDTPVCKYIRQLLST